MSDPIGPPLCPLAWSPSSPTVAQAGHALPILWARGLGHGVGEAISALTWARPKPASLGALFWLEENSHFSLTRGDRQFFKPESFS